MAITVHRDASTSTTTVEFTLDDDAPAGEVSVVGSFNGWSAGTDPLVPQDDGTRSVTVAVPSDHDMHFRYLAAEGVWFDDPDADEITDGGSVLHLGGSDDAEELVSAHDVGEDTLADQLPEEEWASIPDPQSSH